MSEVGNIGGSYATVQPTVGVPPQRTTLTSFVVLLAALGSACAEDPGSLDAAADTGANDAFRSDGSGAARVELGTGTANFVDIPVEGAELELVAGPQGGWHLEVTARLYDLTVENLLLAYRIEREGMTISKPVEFSLTERRLVRDGDRWLRAGDNVIFEITAPADVVGDTVTVVVTADPTDGPIIMDSRTVTVIDLVSEL